jgi:hypothetical protein
MRLAFPCLLPSLLLCMAFRCDPIEVTSADTSDTASPPPDGSITDSDGALDLEVGAWAYDGVLPGSDLDGGCLHLQDGHVYLSGGEDDQETDYARYTATATPGGFLLDLRYTWNPVAEHASPRTFTGYVVVSDARTGAYTTVAIWPCEVG